MGKRDPRVDEYIAKSADFAKPILNHIRAVVHDACPQVEETIKWRMPHFEYGGIICGMAAFKEHCALHIWKGSVIVGEDARESMGQFGRLAKISDLPPDKTIAGYIKRSMKIREEGAKGLARAKPKKKQKAVVVPAELTSALRKNKKAAAAFDGFPPSHKREYAEWISDARGEDTRKRRVDTAVEWMAEGKSRNWKYEKR
jgi:uncharacterized protein YdeI (YjbR/CyaY-like superfamily)